MNTLRKLLGTLFVLSLVLFAQTSPAAAQDSGPWSTVSVSNLSCAGLGESRFLAAGEAIPADLDCTPVAGTFSLYLVGDGTDDYVSLPYTLDGKNEMLVAPGTYEMWQEEAGVMTTITAPENNTVSVTFLHAAEAEDWSRVYFNNLQCETEAAPRFVPAGEQSGIDPSCVTVGGRFLVTGTSAGSTEFTTVTMSTEGDTYIDLAPGTYTVTHEASGLSQSFDFPVNDISAVAFVAPVGSEVTEGTVAIVNAACPNYSDTGFVQPTGSLPEGCVLVAEDFSFYLVGDAPVQAKVTTSTDPNAPTTVELAPTRYIVIHEPTQIRTTISVGSGETTNVLFVQPKASTAPANPQPTAPATSPASPVTKLPSTGSGETATNGAVLTLSGMSALIAAAAIMRLRKSA